MLSLALIGAAAGGGGVVAGGPAGGLAAGVCAGNVPARLSPTNTANVHNTALIGHPDSGCNGRVDGATISQLEPRTTRQIILLSRRGRQGTFGFSFWRVLCSQRDPVRSQTPRACLHRRLSETFM